MPVLDQAEPGDPLVPLFYVWHLSCLAIFGYTPQWTMANQYKECLKCGKVKQHQSRSSVQCRTCTSRSRKAEAVNLLGGKCSECGYSECMAALSFHHKNRDEKSFKLSDMFSNRSLIKVLDEIHKCILLCANCHMKKHEEEVF